MLPKVLKVLLALLALRLVLMAVVPVFEPSEARYAALAVNMARSGDFTVPRFTYDNAYQSFDGKPPLVFQAGGLACLALGAERPAALQFAVRVFPLLSALAVLFIVFWAVRSKTRDPVTASLATGIAATVTAFYAAAGIAMTDMTLTACVAGALLVYDRFADSRGARRLALAAAVAALLGAGMLAKGPVALVEFALPVALDATVNRRWRSVFDWRWLAVTPVFLAVAVPWFVLVERANPGAVWYFFYNENFMRFVSHDYGDRYGAGREAFRGVSVLWALVATLPWSLVPLYALVRRGRGALRSAGRRVFGSFEVLSVLALVGFWALTSRVLLYYLFPVIPLFAAALAQYGERSRLGRLFPWAAAVTAAVLTVAFGVGTFASDRMSGAATGFHPMENHYAYEFYHGTPSPQTLEWAREFKRRHEAERARRKKEAAE